MAHRGVGGGRAGAVGIRGDVKEINYRRIHTSAQLRLEVRLFERPGVKLDYGRIRAEWELAQERKFWQVFDGYAVAAVVVGLLWPTLGIYAAALALLVGFWSWMDLSSRIHL